MRSPQFEAVQGPYIAAVAAGCTLEDAAVKVGVPYPTVRGWLKRGRLEQEGPFASFERTVTEARLAELDLPDYEAGNRDDHRLLVWRAAKAGSTQAMKLYWEILNRDDTNPSEEEAANPLKFADELAVRRSTRPV